ncbi:MAG: hypothetical protein ABR508_08610 [Candidatus Baltobacteraceae bacterium]
MPLIPAAHGSIASTHSFRISAFVKRYGEKSAGLIRDALVAPAADSGDALAAKQLIDSIGTETAAMLPNVINAYYCRSNVDARV